MRATNLKTWLAIIVFLLAIGSTTALADTIYVDANAPSSGNGLTWLTAYKYLQDGLAAAVSGNEIWVAASTYKPDQGGGNTLGDRWATFQLENGVAIYGGFPSGGGQWTDRDPSVYETILSGDIGSPGNRGDNSHHVVTGSGTNTTAVLDGFTITAGYANVGLYSSGSGMYNKAGSPTVTNCIFSANCSERDGGGMFNYGGSNPTVTNCRFTRNWTLRGSGGGMSNYMYSSPTITNCTFSGNLTRGYGGGMANSTLSNPTVTNCTFFGNSAPVWPYGGGGMYNGRSYPTVTNCILWGNTAPSGSQIYNGGGSSPNVSYSDIEGGYPGTGNVDADPCFADTANNDYHLLSHSPCIDAGTNDAPELPETDFDGEPRIMDGDNDGEAIVDMGADELYGLDLDLVVTAADITFVPDSPVEPGTIIVVSAEVHNFGTEDVNSFVVRFFNGDPDSGGIQIGADREITSLAGGASEIVSVAFTTSAEPQSYEIFVLADATSQIEEVNKANNKAFRILTAGPDLCLTSSDISFSAEVAGEVRITAEVHNVGKGNIAENIEVSFYNGDPDSGGIFIDDATIPGGIPEGLSGIAEIDWVNPPLGTYNIYVVVDPEGEITEATKANNKAFNILSATLDLTLISEDICFNPESAIIGQQVEISATIHNHGFLPCEEFVVRFYDGDPAAGGTELGTAEVVGGIAGLGSVQVSILSVFTSAGKHEIYVLADADNQIEETNEDNNIASKSLYVQYATIQETIDAASPGDTLYIGPGTYNENVLINKSITLIGAGSTTTIIDGNGIGDVVLVTTDNVTIKGFTVQNSIGDGSGIHLTASNANVSENSITQCYYGIFCDHSSGSYIAYNTVNANSYGIYCEYASGDAIRHNTITNNSLYGAKSYNSTLANCFNWNYFSGNAVGYSYDPEEPVSPLLFADNVLQDNEIGIEVKDASASDLEISKNTIVGSNMGISCENAGPLIRDNALSSNQTAIHLVNSSSPTIEENTISENTTGIVHDESSDPILRDNTMTDNVENVNTIPVADAGDDQTVFAWINGIAEVSLDGSGSYDDDGDELTYLWTWMIDDETHDANGVNPIIHLPVGEHVIELVVNDGIEDSEPNDVVITVVPAVEVPMKFTPQALNPGSKGNWVKAHLVLPDGFMENNVDADTPAMLYPGGIPSDVPMNVFINEDGLVEIEAAFSRSDFCGSATSDDVTEVIVIGLLTSGQNFYGTDTIRIITGNLEYVAVFASHWLEADCGRPDWCGGIDLDQNSVVDFVDFALFDGCCIEVIGE